MSIPWVIKSSIDKITGRYRNIHSSPPTACHGSLLAAVKSSGWNLLIDQTQNPVCYSVTTSNAGQVWLLFAGEIHRPTRFRYHLKYPACITNFYSPTFFHLRAARKKIRILISVHHLGRYRRFIPPEHEDYEGFIWDQRRYVIFLGWSFLRTRFFLGVTEYYWVLCVTGYYYSWVDSFL